MKLFLVFCLLVVISSVNVGNTIKCILSNQNVESTYIEVFKLITSKEFGKIIPLAIAKFPQIKEAVTKCLYSVEDDDVILRGCYHPILYAQCLGVNPTDSLQRACHRYFCEIE